MKNTKFALIVTYSFDDTVTCFPFDTEEKAVAALREDFEREKNIDIYENGYDTTATVEKDGMSAKIVNWFSDHENVTEWRVTTMTEYKSFKAIAIDGPAGAGKTTLAKALAKAYGFTYVDTGKMFRAIAFAALKMCVQPERVLKDSIFLEGLMDRLTLDFVGSAVDIDIKGGAHTVVEDAELRTEEISFAASTVSKQPVVRTALLKLQRDIARKANVVMEGRDIGTVVLPWAAVKFFLTANPKERADRRVKQLIEKGEQADYNTVYEQLIARDKQDSERETAPLVQAEDAILIDSTDLTLDEVKAVMMLNIEARTGLKRVE